MEDLTKLTVDDIKSRLVAMRIDFKSKERKADLLVKLENALIAAHKAYDSELARAYNDNEGVKVWADKDEIELLPMRGTVVTHLPNSERVQKYAHANRVSRDGQQYNTIEQMVKLTPRQIRRVRKNANKHGEDLMYGPIADVGYQEIGASLLARTPEGMGIFHRFSD